MPTNAKSYGTIRSYFSRYIGKPSTAKKKVIRGSARYKGSDTMQSMEDFIGSTYGTMTSGKTLKESKAIAKRNRDKKERAFRTTNITLNSGDKIQSSLTKASLPIMRATRELREVKELFNKKYPSNITTKRGTKQNTKLRDPFMEGINASERSLLNQLYGSRSLFKRK